MIQSSHTGVVLFWFRRDLRLEDNTALFHALRSGYQVVPVFIFDRTILDRLDDVADRRVIFIHRQLESMKSVLEEKHGSSLHVFHGEPVDIIRQLIKKWQPAAVYANEDYEPYARERDGRVRDILDSSGAMLHLYKDHVIFAKDDIVKSDHSPYTIFTPYSKQWLAQLSDEVTKSLNIPKYDDRFYQSPPVHLPTLGEIGFKDDPTFNFPAQSIGIRLLEQYGQIRDIPGEDGTSHLGIHLRFGTISIRRLVRQAKDGSAVFLNELIWREFFQQILWHFPHVVDSCFKPQYEGIEWRNNEHDFKAWCEGKTGYPLVDAGMRELNATGFMHNRVRMVTASFLVKHLLIDWRWGEAYFAEKLLDYELASNNGNWQWAAGTGCDAAPYFRIFNPTEQARKFDPDGKYVHKWIPELGKSEYPLPIVDHKEARERVLRVYREAVQQGA